MTAFVTDEKSKRQKRTGLWHSLGKKRPFRVFAQKGLPLLMLAYRILYKSLRVRLLDSEGRPVLEGALPKRAIYIGWHGNMAVVPAFFSKMGVTFLASKSRDAKIYGGFLRAFGGYLAMGSRVEDGPSGVMSLIRSLHAGRPVALSPDGPKGPRHRLKPGVALVALAAKAPVVPIGVYADRKVVFRGSWDRAWVPLPFSRVFLVFSDPLNPEAFEGYGKGALEPFRRAIEEGLNNAEAKAKAFCRHARDGWGL